MKEGSLTMSQPNLNLLNLMAADVYAAEPLKSVKLNKLKSTGEIFFKRKPNARGVFVVNHYNAAEKEYSCSNYDTGKEIFLKSTATVYIGFEY